MSLDLIVALGGVFAFVAITAGSLASIAVSRSSPERRRLDALARQAPGGTGVLVATPLVVESRQPAALAALMPKSAAEMTRLRRRLARAGYDRPEAASIYGAAELLTPLAIAALAFWFFSGIAALVLACVFGAIGYLLPGVALERLIARRRKVIQNGLPDALDLFIVCLEAGSSLDQAIVKATEELEIAYPALSDELRMLTTEVRAGKPRMEAFRNLASRTGVDDVRALVAMLLQTDRFGTSVAQALRTHAATARTKRRQRAEESAAKIGVKLVFPLVFCLFPAFYAVTLGPAVIQFVRIFFGQMTAGR